MPGRDYRQYQVLAAPVFVPVAAVVALDWFQPLSTPPAHFVEPGLSAAWTQYHTGFVVPTPITDIKAFLPLSEPVRAKQDIRWRQALAWSGHTPAPAVAIEYWWGALSEPVRTEPGLGAAWTQYHTGFVVPAPAADVTWGWFSQLSDPPPIEQGLGAEYQQVSTVGAQIAFSVNWYRPFSEPVRSKSGLHARQQFLALNPTTPAGFTDLRNYWYQPLSEPVRSKKAVAWQQFFTVSANYTPFVFSDSWWRPLSEPVRSKEAVPWQQFYTADWAQITDLRVYWYRPLSEPVHVKAAVAWQQFFTTDLTTPAAFTDLRNYWYQPLSEPVRSKSRAAWYQPFTTDWQWNVVVRLEWFGALSEPVRSKEAVVWQQFFTTDPTTPANITDLRNFWYQPFSEPVRSKKSVPWQQFFAIDWTSPNLKNYWYRPLSEPVRFKKSVPWQQPFATDWKWGPPAVQVFAGWYKWLSEPQRQRQGLHAARQQFFTTDWKWSPPTSGLVAGWHRWLSEPVRVKPGLHASRQQFFTMDWKWDPPIQVPVSYILSATEQGDTGRLFYASMDIVIGAYVTITEEEVGNMAVVTITARSE